MKSIFNLHDNSTNLSYLSCSKLLGKIVISESILMYAINGLIRISFKGLMLEIHI